MADLRDWFLGGRSRRRTNLSIRADEILSGLEECERLRPPVILLSSVQALFDLEGKGLLGTILRESLLVLFSRLQMMTQPVR